MTRAYRKVVECSEWRSATKKCRGGWTTTVAYDVVLDCGHKRSIYGGDIRKKPTRALCRDWKCTSQPSGDKRGGAE